MTERFVKTSDILPLVKRNELTLIIASGIPWKAGQRGKIACPYPDHGGDADWRFDEKTGYVHCTCNSQHSVLDCLSMLRGDAPKSPVAFELSKIEAAERLGRSDLIKTKRDPASAPFRSLYPPTWHNGFEAAKLLTPPPHLRNDDLYYEYMSARLGVPRDQVPTPSTPFVGISSLEYFDTTDDGGDRQRKLLCLLPCIVFGMINVARELTGTIRIYLDPNGREKAVVGLDAKGNERPVKPFSRGTKVGGEVHFGDPLTATVKVGCEGIENGAAIAYAAATMNDPRVLVACGGTAAFMAGLERQPDIKRFIAAADRDEEQEDPKKPPTKTGEKAATRLLSRYREDVSVSLAMPGKSGEKVDWLDVLRRDGFGAVYNGVFNTPVWEPDAETVSAPKVASRSRMLDIGSDVELAVRALEGLEAKYGKIVFAEGSFWRYAGTHWVQLDKSSLRLHVHTLDGSEYVTAKGVARIKLSKRQIDSILNEMEPIAAQDGKAETFSATAPGINCKNGFIEFDADGVPTLVPHSPEHRCRHVIDAAWSGSKIDEVRMKGSLLSKLLAGSFLCDATRGMTDREREEAKDDATKKVMVIAEVMGAAALGMATRIKAPKAVVLLGLTAENGKSQMLDIIRGLLPEDAVSSIPAGKVGDEKYLVQLVGKLLNMSDELSSAESVAGDNFKKIVTGDHIAARDLFKSVVSFKPKAQHVFATNALPSFKGGLDRGVRRRLIVIEFNRTIPTSERVAEIGLRIATEELDLLLDFAVSGAARLIRQGKFTDLASSESAINKWVLQTDPVEAWLDECVTHVTGSKPPRVATKVAYESFRKWCSEAGYNMVPAINRFSERVESSGKGYGRVRDANGRYFTNMSINEDGNAFQSFGSPL